ncbi:small nuclear ribonucleoprotein E isoform X1 [Pteronotus mesoamericanus]|uniref:small nuclear ribonucleoprotein E isoform X1 n=1 Tax=Pteronotus mesoamericanus TaxID=1884717 RepID=UPI0023EDF258|nr:small nuclear ribonucleoprotein E isoform X1 [Pteronotus parnellii mesoamericanus]
MAYRGQGQKVQKVMVQPINLIFRYLQNRSRIQVWLYEQVNMRIEGCIIGFDEYMNLVLDDAEEIHSKTKSRKQLDGEEGGETERERNIDTRGKDQSVASHMHHNQGSNLQFREKGREEKRKGEKHQCERETPIGCFPYMP